MRKSVGRRVFRIFNFVGWSGKAWVVQADSRTTHETTLGPRHASWVALPRRWCVLLRDGFLLALSHARCELGSAASRIQHNLIGDNCTSLTVCCGSWLLQTATALAWPSLVSKRRSSMLLFNGIYTTWKLDICCSCCQLLLLECLVRLPSLLPPLMTVSSGSSKVV